MAFLIRQQFLQLVILDDMLMKPFFLAVKDSLHRIIP